jgi:hypothetical protein
VVDCLGLLLSIGLSGDPEAERRGGQVTAAAGRRAARAILIDDLGQLMLIKRTKPRPGTVLGR